MNGEFEELKDVSLFQKVRTNKHGLPIYIWLRGTTRAENIHQKMKVAVGPWGLGCGRHIRYFFSYTIGTTYLRASVAKATMTLATPSFT